MNLRTRLIGAAFTACALTLAGAAHAASIVGLYNTGAGFPLGTNGVDLHWTATTDLGDPLTAYVSGTNGVFPVGTNWIADTETSRWIGPTASAGTSADPRTDGFYEYNLKFNLTGPTGASFLARFAADNAVSWIRLNDLQLVAGPAGGFTSFTNFGANSGFKYGENNLTIRVVNFGQASGNPTGLRVEFLESTAGVPEPATWGLMIVGLGAAGSMIRRRRAGLA